MVAGHSDEGCTAPAGDRAPSGGLNQAAPPDHGYGILVRAAVGEESASLSGERDLELGVDVGREREDRNGGSSRSPGAGLVEFAPETPDGRYVTPALVGVEPAVQFYRRHDLAYYRVALPAPQGSRAGQWKALLALGGKEGDGRQVLQSDAPRRALPYTICWYTRTAHRGEPLFLRLIQAGGGRLERMAMVIRRRLPDSTRSSRR
jgi:hypothetical protein